MAHQSDEEPRFFDRERERLSREITSSFEELLSSTNGLNRKLEEVMGMTKEYATIAELWHSFSQLMKQPEPDVSDEREGRPGTGTHIVGLVATK